MPFITLFNFLHSTFIIYLTYKLLKFNRMQCIFKTTNTLQFQPSNAEVALERDAFMYRAYIAQKNYRTVLNEITSSSNPKLQPLRLLAEYLSNPSKKQSIVSTIDEQVNKGNELSNDLFLITAATVYYHENNLEAALRLLLKHIDAERVKVPKRDSNNFIRTIISKM